jgi:hypothetical protein
MVPLREFSGGSDRNPQFESIDQHRKGYCSPSTLSSAVQGHALLLSVFTTQANLKEHAPVNT